VIFARARTRPAAGFLDEQCDLGLPAFQLQPALALLQRLQLRLRCGAPLAIKLLPVAQLQQRFVLLQPRVADEVRPSSALLQYPLLLLFVGVHIARYRISHIATRHAQPVRRGRIAQQPLVHFHSKTAKT
jgi:hypothetical protein